MIILGITGSVGMGKTTVSGMFAKEGAAVCNADAIVHNLFVNDEEVLAEIKNRWPEAIIDGEIHRSELGKQVFGNDKALKELEAILHPRVVKAEEEFVAQAEHAGIWLVVLDIPLLFETGAEKRLDYVAVVSAGEAKQRERVMRRPNMTEEKFNAILARQMSDQEKRKRADFVIETDKHLDETHLQVKKVVAELRKQNQEKLNA